MSPRFWQDYEFFFRTTEHKQNNVNTLHKEHLKEKPTYFGTYKALFLPSHNPQNVQNSKNL